MNVESAHKCGWNAEVYTGFQDFEEKLGVYLDSKDTGG